MRAHRTLVLGVLLAAGCEPVGLRFPEEQATLGVAVQGLTPTTEMEVPPGRYRLEAEGRVEEGRADIDIQILALDGELRGFTRISVPALEAGAEDGDQGGGQVEVEAVPAGVTEVRIPFQWASDQPGSGWNATLDFSRGPDVQLWTVTPIHGLRPGDTIDVEVKAESESGDDSRLRGTATLGPALGELRYDPERGFVAGSVLAPITLGANRLEVRVDDADEGSTTLQKPIILFPCSASANGCVEREGDAIEVTLCDGFACPPLLAAAPAPGPCDPTSRNCGEQATRQAALELKTAIEEMKRRYHQAGPTTGATFDRLIADVPEGANHDERVETLVVARDHLLFVLGQASEAFDVLASRLEHVFNNPQLYIVDRVVANEGDTRTERTTVQPIAGGWTLVETVILEGARIREHSIAVR